MVAVLMVGAFTDNDCENYKQIYFNYIPSFFGISISSDCIKIDRNNIDMHYSNLLKEFKVKKFARGGLKVFCIGAAIASSFFVYRYFYGKKDKKLSSSTGAADVAVVKKNRESDLICRLDSYLKKNSKSLSAVEKKNQDTAEKDDENKKEGLFLFRWAKKIGVATGSLFSDVFRLCCFMYGVKLVSSLADPAVNPVLNKCKKWASCFSDNSVSFWSLDQQKKMMKAMSRVEELLVYWVSFGSEKWEVFCGEKVQESLRVLVDSTEKFLAFVIYKSNRGQAFAGSADFIIGQVNEICSSSVEMNLDDENSIRDFLSKVKIFKGHLEREKNCLFEYIQDDSDL